MIPVLFEATSVNFNTNGIGALTDVISCKVTEERNGIYELEMELATTSPHFNQIKEGRIIVADPFKNGSRQAFEIYEISKPLNQIITVRANHISYRASFIPVKPFIATGITQTLQLLDENAVVENPFTLYSDFTNEESTYNQSIPKSLRACLGGTEGSMLDTFAGGGAGEYEWDNFTIKFLQHRGQDNGVYLRYKKNITDFNQEKSIEETITGVLPYWTSEDNSVVLYGEIQYAPNHTDYANERVVVLDLSSEFATAPTELELNLAGQQYVSNSTVNEPKTNITLSFVDLVDTNEQSIAENINLCDTVHVVYEPLGITFTQKVIKTTWDVLKERYESIEIGTPKSSIAKTIATAQGDISSLVTQGKKLVSVTQQIDREVGEITSTVAVVQGDIIEVDNRLSSQIATQATQIQQNAGEIVLRALQETVDREFGEVEGRVEQLETNVSISTEGLKLKQNDDGSFVLINDSGMSIFANNQRQAYATTEGFYASTFLTGDWHIQPANNGNSLNFFKKGS